jgi:N-ethylmaleimide reductase
MANRKLLTPYALGALVLPNRIVMAPMTRCRATNGDLAPSAMHAQYYAQRASAGLIVSEGTVVSEQARGYAYTPGLYSAAQNAGWQQVTEAVHRAGGRIFAQLWHCGRVGHRSLRADRSPPVAPGAAAVQAKVMAFDDDGNPAAMPCDPPRTLATTEVKAIVADFAQAARNAAAAGFDGVEIHGANGYLLDEFRCPVVNARSDEYGGSLANRCRLLLEIAAAVSEAVGHARVGVRISPLGTAHDMPPDPEPALTYGHIACELDRIGIAYLHVYDQSASWIHDPGNALLQHLRASFSGALMLCGGFDRDRAEAVLQSDLADLIAFGKPFISNPDLVQRLRLGSDLAPWQTKTFYRGDAQGYIDYPTLDSLAVRQ